MHQLTPFTRCAHSPLNFDISDKYSCSYLSLMSKFKGESDLGLCMTWVLAKRLPLRSANFRCLNVFGGKIRREMSIYVLFFTHPKNGVFNEEVLTSSYATLHDIPLTTPKKRVLCVCSQYPERERLSQRLSQP